MTAAVITGILALVSPALTGCYNGPAATTTVQATQPTGSGAYADMGMLRLQNLLLVAPNQLEVSSATLIGRVFNDGQSTDTLRAIVIGGAPAAIMVTPDATDPLAIAANGDIPLSYPLGGPMIGAQFPVPATMSTYVPVVFDFENAGIIEVEVLLIANNGPYADVPLM
jgi:hypothetical protein